MAQISAAMVKELRERTDAGMMDCKKALVECDGDMEKAVDFLRKKGLAMAAKRAGRETTEGTVQCYIHAGNKLGVMVEVDCETDFVAKTDQFIEFAKEVAMHIAASDPMCITREDAPQDILDKEREIYAQQAKESGKPDNIIDKIVDGRIEKYLKENCLMDQPFVKNPDLTIQDLLNELVAKMGENITIRQFARFHVGA